MAGLLTFGSFYSPRLPDLFRSHLKNRILDKSVVVCEFRSRSQRRVRTGIAPVSLLAPGGYHKASRSIFAVLINYPGGVVNVFLKRSGIHNNLDTGCCFIYGWCVKVRMLNRESCENREWSRRCNPGPSQKSVKKPF